MWPDVQTEDPILLRLSNLRCEYSIFTTFYCGFFFSKTTTLKWTEVLVQTTRCWCAFLLGLISSHRECGSTAVTQTYIFAHIDLAWLCCHDDLQGPADSILLIVTKTSAAPQHFFFTSGLLIKVWNLLPDYPGTAGRFISTTFLLQFIRRCNS